MPIGQRHKALLALRASLLVALLFACSTPGGAHPAPPEGSELGSGLAGATGDQPGNDSPSHRAAVEPPEAGTYVPQAGCTGGGIAATGGSGGGSCASGGGTANVATSAASVLSGLPADAPEAEDAMPMGSTGRGEQQQQQQQPSAGWAAAGEAKGAQIPVLQQPPQQQQQQAQDQQADTAADTPAASAAETASATESAVQADAAAAAAAAASAAAAQAVAPAAEEVPMQAVHQEEQHNFALSKEGAKVLAANKEAKKTGALLDDDSDTFLKNDCRADGKWVMLELSQVAKVSRLELSQFELYSARVREFELLGRQSHPRTEGVGSEYGRTLNSTQWKLLGSFTAEKVKGSQTFVVEHPRWVRYLLLRFLTQHGPEPVCALNGVSVFGRSAVEELEDQLASEAEEELGLLPSPPEPPQQQQQQQQQQQAEQAAPEAVPLPMPAPAEAAAAAAAAAQAAAGAAPEAALAAAEQQNAAQGAAAAVQQQAPTQPEVGQAVVSAAQVQQQAVAGAGSGAAEVSGDAPPVGTPAPPTQQAATPPRQTGQQQQQAGDAVGSAGASTNGNGSTTAPAAGGSGGGDSAGAGGAGKQEAGAASAQDGAAAAVSLPPGGVAPLDTRLPAEAAVPAGSRAAPASDSGSQAPVGAGAASVASTTAAQQAGQAQQQAAPSTGGTALNAGGEPKGTATVPPAAGTATAASGPTPAAAAAPGQQQQRQQQPAQQAAQAATPLQPQASEQALPLPLSPPVNAPSPPPVVSPGTAGTAGSAGIAGSAGSPAQPPAGRQDDILELPLAGLTAKGKKGGSSMAEILVQEIKAAKLQHKLLAKNVAEVARNASWQYAELAGDVASLAATLAKLPADQNVSEEALAAHIDLLVKAHLVQVTQQLAGLQEALASSAKQQHALLCFLALTAGLLAMNATTFGEQWPRAKWAVLLLAAANGLVGVALQLQGSAVRPPIWLQALPGWAQAH